MKASRIAALVALLGFAACYEQDMFACESNDACQSGGEGGVCELSGWCSFPDATCPGGRRYGNLAGGGLDGVCVGDEADSDAGTTGAGTTSPTTSTSTTLNPTTTSAGTSTTDDPSTSTSTSTTGPDSGGVPFGPWWDCAWQARKPVTVAGIEDLELSAPVEDAVLLVALDGARIDYTRVGEGGLGLRFVGNDHETLLRHEVEGWDAEGTSFIWVHVPSVAQGTRFFMYYDGPDEPAPFGIGDVWPPAYGAVWHMSDGGLDATLNANTADGVVDEVPGQIGPGAATPSDGGTGYVVGAAAGVNNLFGTGGTFSAWVRPAGFDALGQDVVAMKAELSSGDGGWALVLDGDADSFAFSRGYAMQRRITWTMVDAVPLAAWVHVAVIYDDSAGVAGEATFVVNGATAATQRTSNGNPSNPADGDAAQALQIATELVGRFDEVRVRSGGTVTDAILDYRSQTDQLLEYGPLDISGCFADPG